MAEMGDTEDDPQSHKNRMTINAAMGISGTFNNSVELAEIPVHTV